tara:strand:- start:183 stop:572 length:390 start_codon:yes stop_codon:yes gene_type:complete
MSKQFKLEIISPEKIIYSSEPTEVVIPSYEGYMTILYDHSALVTFLRPGVIEVKGNETKKFFIEEGTVEFSDNKMLILTNTTIDIKELNKEKIDKMIELSQKTLREDNLNDKKKFILSHKVEVLRMINQ